MADFPNKPFSRLKPGLDANLIALHTGGRRAIEYLKLETSYCDLLSKLWHMLYTIFALARP